MSKDEAIKVAELGEKPGWQTSEFWLTLLSQLVGIALVIFGSLGDEPDQIMQILGVVQSVLSKLGYDSTRKGVKASASHAKAVLMATKPVDPSRGSPPA